MELETQDGTNCEGSACSFVIVTLFIFIYGVNSMVSISNWSQSHDYLTEEEL